MPGRNAPPTITPEAREMQLVNLAYDLLEQRLRDGTATSQEVTTMIRYGTQKAQLELDIMRSQKDLMDAKRDSINASIQNDEMFQEAIKAMGIYSGQSDDYDSELY